MRDFGDNVSTFLSTGNLQKPHNPRNGYQDSLNSSQKTQHLLNPHDQGMQDKSQSTVIPNRVLIQISSHNF